MKFPRRGRGALGRVEFLSPFSGAPPKVTSVIPGVQNAIDDMERRGFPRCSGIEGRPQRTSRTFQGPLWRGNRMRSPPKHVTQWVSINFSTVDFTRAPSCDPENDGAWTFQEVCRC